MPSAGKIESTGAVILVPVSEFGESYPIFIGHDENNVVVQRLNPPRFEIISTSSLQLARTIDALDNCCSVQYKNELIASASDGFSHRHLLHHQVFCHGYDGIHIASS